MKLPSKLKYAFYLVAVIFLVCFSWFLIKINSESTYAEGDIDAVSNLHYVVFYDNGSKLIVRTDAPTVGDAIKRADFVINDGDIVEPDLDSPINTNEFFVNIYRARPVVVKDGLVDKYVMTASYDAKTVAGQAGLTIYDGDEIKLVPNANFLEAGAASVYEIKRNGGRNISVEEEIAFEEIKEKDFNLKPGESEVRQLGEVGAKVITYNVLYVDGKEVQRELVSEEVIRDPKPRIVAVGASAIERKPLTASMGRNRYTVTLADGRKVERQETYYDLPMKGVMGFCGGGTYSVRADGVKVDQDGYVLVAANLSRYPRCSIVETSLGPGKVYDTGTFAATNPEQFDLATDWTNRNGV